MKRFIGLVLVVFIAASCSKKTVVHKTPPPGQVKKTAAPGQMKKVTGSQSAAPYAPGQQKKTATASKNPAPKAAANNGKTKGSEKKKKVNY
jgi:hypothetical protein